MGENHPRSTRAITFLYGIAFVSLSIETALFIVFEGIDGSGKTSQARMLAARLAESNIPFLLTAEPSEGAIGRKIRDMTVRQGPEEETRLFTEDRRDHLEQVILPALNQGRTVICDRYVYSSVAYQGARGIDPNWILAQNRAFAREADVTFLLEVPLDEALRRIRTGRSNSLSPFEVRRELESVDAIYRSLDDPRIVRVDGSLPPERVHAAVIATLRTMGLPV